MVKAQTPFPHLTPHYSELLIWKLCNLTCGAAGESVRFSPWRERWFRHVMPVCCCWTPHFFSFLRRETWCWERKRVFWVQKENKPHFCIHNLSFAHSFYLSFSFSPSLSCCLTLCQTTVSSCLQLPMFFPGITPLRRASVAEIDPLSQALMSDCWGLVGSWPNPLQYHTQTKQNYPAIGRSGMF